MATKRREARPLPPMDWTRYAGYANPNTTQVPDELIDWHMAYLTGAELKVLLYIVRRTFGFKKDDDAISLDQLCHGICRKDGRELDRGTGLARPTVLEALRGLRKKNLITARQHFEPTTGQRPTIYGLKMAGTSTPQGGMSQHNGEYGAASNARPEGVYPAIPGEHAPADPQQTASQDTDTTTDRTPIPTASSDLWPAVLGDLRTSMTPDNYARWFAPTRFLSEAAGVLIVAVPDTLRRDYLELKGQAAIARALRRLGADGHAVRYVVA